MDRATLIDLRKRSGAGITLCKNALKASAGDIDEAMAWIARQGKGIAAGKSDRATSEGRVFSYVHSLNPKLAALVDLVCETDFVARTEMFTELGDALAMQVVAYRPQHVSLESVPAEERERMRQEHLQAAIDDGKPKAVAEKIAAGRLAKWQAESCLLDQPFLKDPDRQVREIIEEKVASLKENIQVAGFVFVESGGKPTVGAA